MQKFNCRSPKNKLNINETSCIIIGTGNLAIFCHEQLLNNNITILAGVPFDKKFENHLRNNSINILTLDNISKIYKENSIDFIFSVVNPIILNEQILKIAHTAINYHDSLLPKYAGVFATARAVINNEKHHGITWHFMNSKFDAGDIIIQHQISIDDDETTASLNLKCYEAAKETFSNIVSSIKSNNLTYEPQRLEHRTSYISNTPPINSGFLDWSDSVSKLDMICRGLNFGIYNNLFGSAKVYINGKIYVIKEWSIKKEEQRIYFGKIIHCNDQQINIAVKDGVFQIKSVTGLNGTNLLAKDIIEENSLNPLDILPTVSEKDTITLCNILKESMKYEPLWLDQLSKSQFCIKSPHDINSTILENYTINLSQIDVNYIISYLYLILTQHNYQDDIWIDNIFKEGCNPFNYFYHYLPLLLNIRTAEKFSDIYLNVKKRLAFIKEHKYLARDVLIRNHIVTPFINTYPSPFILVKLSSTSTNDIAPIVIEIGCHHIKVTRYKCSNPDLSTTASIIHKQICSLTNHKINSRKNINEIVTLPLADLLLIKNTNNTLNLNIKYNDRLENLFINSANINPYKIAIIDGNTKLTYQEVDDLSSRCARQIIEKLNKSSPGKIIGIYFDKSWQQIIAVLGVLKAGHSFMPLSKEDPYGRIEQILAQSKAFAIVYDNDNNKVLEIQKNVINLEFNNLLIKHSITELPILSDFISLAYIIFTSGSTGKPKGVMISHKNAINTVLDINKKFGINSSDKLLALSRLSFDLSIYDIFGTFAAGATLVMVNTGELLNVENWHNLIIKHKITVWNSAPALMTLLTDYLEITKIKIKDTLRLILLSGDWIPLNLFGRISNVINSEFKAISLGGATEASIWSIYYHINIISKSWKSIPYGKPLDNQQIYILDKSLRLMPVGAIGEICIGGVGVAMGYLNDADLTNKHFIIHHQFGRIYKTGDLGRLNWDGNHEIIGRLDSQLKINGMRVDTTEIEYIASQHPKTKTSKVSIYELGHEKKLALFIETREQLEVQELKDYIAMYLPVYMIPSKIIFVNEWPITTNGKIDYKKLLNFADNKLNTLVNNITDHTLCPLAYQISQIWKDVLNLQDLPKFNDNFFQMGGDSILSLKVTHKIMQMGYKIQSHMIFKHPTIEKLIEKLEKNKIIYDTTTAILDQKFFLTTAQQGLLNASLINPNKGIYVQQASWKYSGDFNVETYKNSWELLISEFECLRIILVSSNEHHYQYLPNSVTGKWFRFHNINGIDTKELQQHYERISCKRRKTFKLFDTNLFTVDVFSSNDYTTSILFTFHHIILDGISLDNILNKLHYYYEKQIHQEKFIINQDTSYSHYLINLDKQCNEKNINLKFWEKYTNDLIEKTYLPFYKKGIFHNILPTVNEISNKIISLNVTVTAAIKNIAKKLSVTEPSVLQAIWSYIMSYYTNKTIVMNGLVFSGRNSSLDIIDTAGYFLLTLPIQVKVDPGMVFSEFVFSIHNLINQLDRHGTHGSVSNYKQKLEIKNLFDHILVFNRTTDLNFKNLNHLKISNLDFYEKTNYPLTVTFYLGNEISIKFAYDPSQIDSNNIELASQHFSNVLQNINTVMDSRLSEIDLFQTEKQCKTHIVPKANIATLGSIDIFNLIQEKSNKHPDQYAIICTNGDKYTYQDIIDAVDAYSNGVLRLEGPLVLYLPRVVEYIILILLCLKHKKTYIPLSEDITLDQLETLCSEAGVKNIITSRYLATGSFPHETNCTYVEDLVLFNTLNSLNAENKKSKNAYIIFTSGTTAKPKGVEVSQESLLNLLLSLNKIIHRNCDYKTIAVTPFTFDIAQVEVLLPLINSGTIILPNSDEIKNPLQLKNLINKFKPSLMQSAPAKWDTLIDSGWNGEHIQYYLSGGDVLPLSLAKKILSFKPVQFLNLYGPTETTIWATYKEVKTVEDAKSIGQPLENTECLILNHFKKQLPDNITGELYITGVGVAKGYINFPNHNNFMTLTQNSKTIYYKTGDNAYKLENDLYFVGRIDRQRKINGIRIELDEIEHIIIDKIGHSKIAVLEHEGDIILFSEKNNYYPNKSGVDLFYFGSESENYYDGYQFILNTAKKADELGLNAIWIPERHFDQVGSLFPNPAILAASIASNTQTINIRAGSLVLPINDTIRVAENWAVVDNLSKGRAGVAFATGWHPRDFILAPKNFESRKRDFKQQIAEVKSLWQGIDLNRVDGLNKSTSIKVFPRPYQPSIPIWISAASNSSTFEFAGQIGANILTHLLIQNISDLKNNLDIYRATLYKSGFDPLQKTVTLMMHTFINKSHEYAVKTATKPLKNYLEKHFQLIENSTVNQSAENFSDKIQDHIDNSLKIYLEQHSLIGSVDHCFAVCKMFKDVGVNDFACLIDFGIENDIIAENLIYISMLNKELNNTSNISALEAHKELSLSMLSDILPAFMLPNKIIPLDKIPLTKHGKINYKKLEEHMNLKHKVHENKDTSNLDDEIVSVLTTIWNNILDNNNIGLDNNFFFIGGNSLKAIRVINAIHKKFEIEITIRDFFKFNSIRTQAKLIRLLNKENNSDKIKHSKVFKNICTYPLSFSQEALWFMHQLEPSSPRYNDSFAFHINGILDVHKLEKALFYLSKAHVALNLAIEVKDHFATQKISKEKLLILKTIRKISPAGEFKDDYNAIIANANKPFDIHKKLCRFVLFMGERDSILLISIHHIITDGLSLEILVNNLHFFYEQISRGEKINVTTNKAFLNYAIEEKNTKASYFQKLYNSWKKDVIIKQPIQYLHNYKRPKVQYYTGRIRSLKFDRELYLKLKNSAVNHNTTVYSLLLTAFIITLRTISKDEQYVIGIPYANRDSIGVEASIGCFVNMLVGIISCADPNTIISDVISAVKEALLHTFSYRKLPFNKLVEFENINRSLSYHPLFQIVFGMYDSTNMSRYIDGMDFDLLDIDFGMARYDLEVQTIQHIDMLTVYFRYNVEIFDNHIISNLLKIFNQTLHSISNVDTNGVTIASIINLNALTAHDLSNIKSLLDHANHIDCQDVYIDGSGDLNIEINYVNRALNHNCLVNSWKNIYNQLYIANENNKYAGWVSSYNNEPYSETVMNEWLDNTLYRINKLMPKRILEIGCGSGLLIDKLIDNCDEYSAIDISQFAVEWLLKKHNIDKFSAYVADAYNLPNQIMQKNYDLIILNSTVQYFPSIFYFLKVIEKLLPLVTSGHIFIGDIINSDLAIHKNLDIYLAGLNQEKNGYIQLDDFCIERLCLDSEIAIPPILISSLKNVYSEISYVATMPKVGVYQSEMNKFRYDCIIGINVNIDEHEYNVYESKTNRISFSNIVEHIKLGSIYRISKIPNHYIIGLEQKLQNSIDSNIVNTINISLPQYGLLPKEIYELINLLNQHKYYYDFLFNSDNLYFDLIILKNYSNKIFSLQKLSTNRDFNTNLSTYWFESYTSNLLYKYKQFKKRLKIKHQETLQVHNENIIHDDNTEKFKITNKIIDIWKNILNLPDVPTDKTFFDLGGDSILSIQMVSRAKLVGLTFTPNDLFETQTINKLVDHILTSSHKKSTKWNAKTQDLSPIQQWLIMRNMHNIHHYNQGLLFEIFSDEPGNIVTQKLERLFSSYANFRLLFLESNNGVYQQYQTNCNQTNTTYFDFSGMHNTQQDILIKQISSNMQQTLNIFKGPLGKIAIFNLGKSIFKLAIVAHNIVIDGISWRIIIDDINYLLEHKKLPAKQENNYFEWIEMLRNYINSPKASNTISYWLSKDFHKLNKISRYWNTSENFYRNQINYCIQIELDLIGDIYSFNSKNSSIEAFILSSIVYAFHNTFNLHKIYIDVESHGRNNFGTDINLSRSLGWFTEIYPMLIEINGVNKINMLHNVSYKLKEAFPFSKSFMALKKYSNNLAVKAKLNSYHSPQILFNYFGDLDKSLSSHKYIKLSDERYNNLCDSNNIRPYVFHFDSMIINKRLEIYFRYSSKITNSDEADKIVSDIKAYLFDLSKKDKVEFPNKML